MKQITRIQDNKTPESPNERNETGGDSWQDGRGHKFTDIEISNDQLESARDIERNRLAAKSKRAELRSRFPYIDEASDDEVLAFDPPAAPAQAQHSPLPWTVDHDGDGNPVVMKDYFVIMASSVKGVVHEANAEFIVRACNNAQRLADACEAYVRARNDGGISMADLSSIADRKIREALAEWSKSI